MEAKVATARSTAQPEEMAVAVVKQQPCNIKMDLAGSPAAPARYVAHPGQGQGARVRWALIIGNHS